METLLLLMRDNPTLVMGFLGGVVGAILVDVVRWRWEVRRRPHNGH